MFKQPRLLALFIVFASITAPAQTLFHTYTGISGFYDYQTNYRAPQYIRACPGTSYIHAIMMVADDSLNISATRGTAYAFSSDGGATWNTFNDIRVPPRRSGFPSLDILRGPFANGAVVANHNTASAGLQSIVLVDYPVGGGAFAEIIPPPVMGGDEPIFPETATAADGSIVLLASRPAGTTTHRTRTSDLVSWQPWSVVTPDFISDGYVAEGSTDGRVGIAIAAPSSPLQWLESTDNGATWPPAPAELLPENIPLGSDTYVITPGFDLVHYTGDTLIVFGVTKLVNLTPIHRFSGIGFYSRSTGFVLAVPHDSVPGVIDTLVKRQVNQFPVGYPAIGVSGSNIVVTFQAFRAETSAAGFNYADVFFTYSSDGGAHWTTPLNLSNTVSLDERYASMSKWNEPGQANIVYQEDPQPGSASFGGDNSPVARFRQRYCRVSGLSTSVEEEHVTPLEFRLEQNYPNPFNPTTTIKFTLPSLNSTHVGRDGDGSIVKLMIYDILGREVVTLVNEVKEPGAYEVTWDAGDQASGMYFCRLQAGGFVTTKKMLLLR